jgi:hypothetical protein
MKRAPRKRKARGGSRLASPRPPWREGASRVGSYRQFSRLSGGPFRRRLASGRLPLRALEAQREEPEDGPREVSGKRKSRFVVVPAFCARTTRSSSGIVVFLAATATGTTITWAGDAVGGTPFAVGASIITVNDTTRSAGCSSRCSLGRCSGVA